MFFKTLSRLFQFAENVNVGEFPRVNYSGTALKFRKRNKNPSLLVYLLHSWQFEIKHFHVVVGKQTYKKAWCTCRVFVLPIVAFLTASLSSPSLLLKLPINMEAALESCKMARSWQNALILNEKQIFVCGCDAKAQLKGVLRYKRIHKLLLFIVYKNKAA